MDNKTRSAWQGAISVVIALLYIGGASAQTHIRGAASPFDGMCFDAWYGSSNDGTDIRLHPCHGGQNQQWSLGPNHSIRGMAGTFQGMCFDAWYGSSNDGTGIRLHPCHGGQNQQWSLGPNHSIHGIAGSFQGMCFDAWLGSSNDGTPIKLHPCHGGANQRWVLEPTPGAWKKIGGPAAAIYGYVGSSGVTATDPQTGDLWYWNETSWTKIGGPGKMFAMGGGAIYGLSPDGSGVWQYVGGGTSDAWRQIGGPASAIYAGPYGLFATNPQTGDLWRWNGTPMSWTKVGGPGKMFAVGSFGVYGLSPDGGGVFKYSGTGEAWNEIGGPASAIYAGGPNELYATNPQTGDLWRWNETPMSWTRIGGPGKMFAIGLNAVYGLSPDGGGVWQYSGTEGVWNRIGGPAGLISASAITVYATNPETNDVWAFNAPPPPPTPTLTFAANPPSITAGQCSTLSWSSTNTNSCNDGADFDTGGATSGSAKVCPTATSSYYLTCRAGTSTVNATATVTVGPPPPPTASLMGAFWFSTEAGVKYDDTVTISGKITNPPATGASGESCTINVPVQKVGTGFEDSVGFSQGGLKPGTWKIDASSHFTGPVSCPAAVPGYVTLSVVGGAHCP